MLFHTLRTVDYGLPAVFAVMGMLLTILHFSSYLEMGSQRLWHNDSDKGRNFHPLFMTLGFFFFQPLGMLFYRICCCYQRDTVTILHAILTSFGLILGIAGLIFTHPAMESDNRFRSFHSRFGVMTVALAAIEVILGIVLYVVLKEFKSPLESVVWRVLFTPHHNYLGVSVFLCSTVCCVSGLSISPFFSHPIDLYYYHHLSPRSKGLFLAHTDQLAYMHLNFVLLAIMILYFLTKDDFRSRGRILIARDEDFR